MSRCLPCRRDILVPIRVHQDQEGAPTKGTAMNDTPRRGYRQLRKGRHSLPGNYYALTFATLNREPILANANVANIIFQCFDWLEIKQRLTWHCIMVMPDHVHTVVQLGHKQPLSNVMKSLKNFTARQINALLGRQGQLWQEAYHDHGIRRDESLNAIIRYCYENPVRRGLVQEAKDYPYWQCKFKME